MNVPTCSRHFREFALTKYPTLQNRPAFLRLFHYICFSSFFDSSTGCLVIPTRRLAEEIHGVPYTTKFNGKAALEEFRDSVLHGLTWTDHSSTSPHGWNGTARTICDFGFDEKMEAELRKEWSNRSDDLVDFVSGRDYLRADRYADRAKVRAAYDSEIASLGLNATQAQILEHLRQVDGPSLIYRKLAANDDAVSAATAMLPTHVADMQNRILAAVRRDPNVYYYPSSNGRTCRLSARGDSILGLKKEVRRAATKGWVECDLRSSQFAILATKLQAPTALVLAESGESLWRELNAHITGHRKDPVGDVKAALKEFIYSLCFGKSQAKLKKFADQYGIRPLLDHPMIQELLAHRKAWFKQIKQDGGAADVWGTWHATSDDRWEGAVAGTVIQSVEMEIIAPIFEVAAKHGASDQFRICLFQHDGATISFNSAQKKARAQRKLKEAVEQRARALGVSTVLEFTDL